MSKLRNPYLDVFLKYMQPPSQVSPIGWEARTEWTAADGLDGPEWDKHIINELNASLARTHLVRYFAWAVPSDSAIKAIAELGKPVIEIGAGTGYWGWLLDQLGVQVTLFDSEPAGGNELTSDDPWMDVREGTEEILATNDGWPEHTLFLCWPPYLSEMPERCLELFKGDTLVHVGEHGGATARRELYQVLPTVKGESVNGWELEREVDIPQWPGIRDYLSIYRRSAS
ncbi:MAG TPA: hypothetical protein VGX26_01025 [Solirubrobacteraceae bacterium]|nr:hypothetical protein [Solirubrobacteraceae bacterium]